MTLVPHRQARFAPQTRERCYQTVARQERSYFLIYPQHWSFGIILKFRSGQGRTDANFLFSWIRLGFSKNRKNEQGAELREIRCRSHDFIFSRNCDQMLVNEGPNRRWRDPLQHHL